MSRQTRLQSLFATARRRSSSSSARSTAQRPSTDRARRLVIEQLEERAMLSASTGIDQPGHDGLLGLLSSHVQTATQSINGVPFEITWDAAPAATTDTTQPLAPAATGASLYGLDSIPALHSNLGAPATLFLDFNGHFEPVWGSYTNATTPAYDFDGDRTTFSDAELANIQSAWNIVAEDFAPFNIDVTTVEPAVLSEGAPIANANGIALRIAIGGEGTDWYGNGSGVGYINSFTNQIANVAYVFAQGNSGLTVGEAASHEAGHSFGLYHQSTYDAYGFKVYEYSFGDFLSGGRQIPIMGITLGTPAIQTWYNGTNSQGATVLQDDMAILAGTTNGFGYRSDDHGNTLASATPLSNDGATWSASGIVGTNTDVDMFSFTVATSDTYRIAVSGDLFSSNLDVALELRDSAGTVIGNANPQDTHNAEIRKGLAPGTYFLAVKSNGTYGWIGEYTVNIDTPSAGITVTPASGTMTTGEDGRATSFSVVLQTAPTADVSIPINSTNTAEGTPSAASLVFTSANWDIPQVITITGVNDGIIDNDIPYTVILGAAVTVDPEYSPFDPADIPVVNLGNDAAGFIYFINNSSTLGRSRLNGSQPETLVDLKALYGSTGSYSLQSFAVDLAHGKMYWTEYYANRIQRANLDGSAVETVVSGNGYSSVALDAAAGKMYWSNYAAKTIQRANLDGSGIEILLTDPALNVSSIVLDTTAAKMYWSDGSQGNIKRADLNGANVEVLWTGVAPTSPNAIALDAAAGKMYWSDTTQDLIRRANLDGTNVEVVVNTATFAASSNVTGLALDAPAGKLYWTDNLARSVYRANLDGSAIAGLEAGQSYRGLAIVHPGPDISVTHRTGLVTSEDGGSDVFRVTLTTQPTANVTVALTSSDTTEGTFSTSSLIFTPANWNVTQTVTVNGVSDTLLDGDIAYTIILAAAVSSDPNYGGRNPADVSVVNRDKAVLQTKFYVVNDAAQNQTYEYNASGGSVESYNLNSGNTAPRGAVSSIAGDKTWVVDANRNVYVYDNSIIGGRLLGSWTAGTLANSAAVEGITTNGTDIWIVDGKSDKVYKYAGAAGRLSGSQIATSSFSLNPNNTNAKDISTDGTSMWVVDDWSYKSSPVRMFKYDMAGAMLGNWTIDAANLHPTGITINPTNISDIWIVDSGTYKVYQYGGATKRTSGSQAAVATFALAAGNTNPQGIADPPAAGMMLPESVQVAATSPVHALDLAIGQWLGDSTRSPSRGSRPLNAAKLLRPSVSTILQHQLAVRSPSKSSRGDSGLVSKEQTSSQAWPLTRLTDEVLSAWDPSDCFGTAQLSEAVGV